MTALVEVGSGRQAPVLVALVVGRRVSVSGQDQAPASLARLAPVAVNAFSVRLCRARYQGRPTALGSLASFSQAALPVISHSPNPHRIPTRASAVALVYKLRWSLSAKYQKNTKKIQKNT